MMKLWHCYGLTPQTTGNGRLKSLAATGDSEYGFSFAYDALGRMASRSCTNVTVWSSKTKQIDNSAWTYDAIGRISKTTNTLGHFGYAYVGATLRLQSAAMSNVVSGSLALLQSTVFDYDINTGDFRLKEIHNKKANNNLISKFNYTYDAQGRIKTWELQDDTAADNVIGYEYDAADQLVAAVMRAKANNTVVREFGYYAGYRIMPS